MNLFLDLPNIDEFSITKITPTEGPTQGGEVLIIEESNFVDQPLHCRFNNLHCRTPCTFISNTSVSCVVESHPGLSIFPNLED